VLANIPRTWTALISFLNVMCYSVVKIFGLCRFFAWCVNCLCTVILLCISTTRYDGRPLPAELCVKVPLDQRPSDVSEFARSALSSVCSPDKLKSRRTVREGASRSTPFGRLSEFGRSALSSVCSPDKLKSRRTRHWCLRLPYDRLELSRFSAVKRRRKTACH
jgi:hypothetical protein